jgi:hypothetical protein
MVSRKYMVSQIRDLENQNNNISEECRLLECGGKRSFTQDLHGATSQKTAFFIVTAVKTSNLGILFNFEEKK